MVFIRVVFVGLPGEARVFGSNGWGESGILDSKLGDLFPDLIARLPFPIPEVPALSVPSRPRFIAGGTL